MVTVNMSINHFTENKQKHGLKYYPTAQSSDVPVTNIWHITAS